MKEASQKKEEKKLYTYQDLIKFTNTNLYSSFGQIKQSIKLSAPQYSFGTSTRAHQPKKYHSKEISKIDCYGNQTPKGPKYNPSSQFLFPKSPSFTMSTQIRNTLDTKAKYEHYLRKDTDTDINEADKVIRQHEGTMRFGGSPRFLSNERHNRMIPGPQYNPTIKPEAPSSSTFSFVSRRAIKGLDPLISSGSTSEILGPGSYYPQKIGSIGNKYKNSPNWSLSKASRDPLQQLNYPFSQTYNLTPAIGTQYQSQKPTKPHFSMGKLARGENRTGIFKAHMEFKPTAVRLQHPRF